ncbi:MAG: ABC transporter ATP-binding protein [Verrucomicrobiota bacterium]|nr:ABC transporter ATP-binding protein [Verrucomicrobiota bacterium]
MSNLRAILSFGAPYLRRYSTRLVLGILLGIFFGFSNATFVWATKTLFERLDPPPPRIETSTPSPAAFDFIRQPIQRFSSGIAQRLNNIIDPWLPKKGAPLTWQNILGGLMFLPLLAGFRGYVGYLSSYCMSWVSERVVKDMRLDVLIKMNSLSLDFFNKTTMGDLMARINADTSALYRCLSLGFSDLIKEPMSILALVTVLFFTDPGLTLLALIFTPLMVIPIRILGKKARKAVSQARSSAISQDSLLIELFSSIRIIKAYSLENRQIDQFRTIYKTIVSTGMKNVQAKELVNPIIEVIATLGLGVVIVIIFYWNKTIPDLIAFLTGVTLMYTPIKKLGTLHVTFQQASVGAQRLLEIFSLKPTVLEKPNPLPIPTFTRALEFQNVSFTYGNQPVLSNISLLIPHGRKLGVAGPSGSGKSTLISLVLRFYDPTAGRILFDGIDLRDASINDLRSQMALVSQDVVIFDQTIAENIGCGRHGATSQEIEAAAKAAFAHDFILQTPNGYQTRVGERGVTLSGGQRQRLSIARAFLRNAPILLLDEATASLDSQAEAEVQSAIDRLSENRTVICVAHRLSTLRNCDQIIILENGLIVQTGGYEELLRQNGLFTQMAERQGIRL